MLGKSLGFCLLVAFVLGASWAAGCGDPDVCNNDRDCQDNKICLHQRCQSKSALDAGREPKAEKPMVPDTRPTPERRVQPEPRVRPESRIRPESLPPKGIRKLGELCDPREHAYDHDKCEAGLACAEYAQTSPTSGAPQPYGICLKACDPKAKTGCPTGTRCIETRDTKTRQPTGLFVCAREVGEGDSCVNLTACQKGLSCIRFGTTGTAWYCHKDCTQDASVCPSGTKCDVANDGKPEKICKKVVSAGEICGINVACDDQSLCFEGNRYGAFFQTCHKKCNSDADCGSEAACLQLSRGGKPIGNVCIKRAKPGEECNHGYACTERGSLCLDLSTSWSRCFQRCNSMLDCGAGMVCDRYSSSSSTKICKPALIPGQVSVNQGACSRNSRAIRLSSSSSTTTCLPSCSQGSGTNAALCGNITPGTLKSVRFHDSLKLVTVGDFGVFATSNDDGQNWARARFPTQLDLRGIATSGDGKVLLVVGIRGVIVRSEDSGKSWAEVSSGVTEDLNGVALSSDGVVAVAVGAKGVLLRSEDSGKTWVKVALTPTLTSDLYAVAVGRDVGAGTSAPIFVAGGKGVLVRSEDGGKTWSTVSGVTSDIFAVALQRERTATGIGGLLTGPGGALWSSTDDGKSWKKETSGVTVALRGAWLDGTTSVVVGDQGTVLHYASNAWNKLNTHVTQDLYDITAKGQLWVSVGSLGFAAYTKDAGKTWGKIATNALQCVGLRGSNGAPSGGACLFLCSPLRQGSDCPPELGRCGSLTLGSRKINVCVPSGTGPGTAAAGAPCTTYSGAPASKRCKKDHTCRYVGGGFFCMRKCSATLKCEGNDICVRSNTLGASYCGKAAKVGESCDLARQIFCEPGARCETNSITHKSTCVKVSIAKKYETCDNSRRPCAEGLICTGLSSTPYRRYCINSCKPGVPNSGCEPGWDCLSTSAGTGICVERCTSPDHVCKVKHVRCQRVTLSDRKHCI